MGKINDIQMYWNLSEDYNFDEERMLDGRIILADDGWFEGIVQASRGESTPDDLVFGIYYPGKAIEVIKVSNLDGNGPYFYRGRRDVKGYDGPFGAVTSTGEATYGVTHVITRDVALFQEAGFPEVEGRNPEAEAQELIQKIAAFKAENVHAEKLQQMYAIKARVVMAMKRDYQAGMAELSESEAVGSR